MEKTKKYKAIIDGVEIQNDVDIESIRKYNLNELISNFKNKIKVLAELPYTDHPRKEWKEDQLKGEIVVIENALFNYILDMVDRQLKREIKLHNQYENVIKRLEEVDKEYKNSIYIDPYLKNGETK